MNCLEFSKPLYFGRESGLSFGGYDAVCNPTESGESGSTNWEISLPTKKFSFGFFYFGRSSDVVIHSTVNCFLVLSFLQFLFAFFRFALLLG
jgi:hypothetical protein